MTKLGNQKPIDPSTPPEHILPLPEDAAPPWWSSKHARPHVFAQGRGGPNENLRPAQVRVRWPLHVDGYINPLEKKLRHFQGDERAPFIVAMDVEGMGAGSFSWYAEHLPKWFATDAWQRLSGVLLFTNSVHWSRIGWTWRLHLNPHAEYPVALTDDALAQATRETGFGLRFQAKPGTAPTEGEHGRMTT